MNDSEYLCPVPKDQRPLNEYKKLKESSNFLWCIQDKNSYFQFLSLIFLVSFLLSALILVISSFSLSNIKYFFISSIFIGLVIVTIFCLRSYLGWQYIYSRLMEATVPYEESGWYDGQVWIKPPEILLQDRLIGTYEIYPGLKRLEKTFAFLLILFVGVIILARNT
jgi:hypothetical protein